jgi:hypothetical protein
MAKRNPTAFVLGSVAIGVAVARFAKASGGRRQTRTEEFYSEPSYGSDVRHESPEVVVDIDRPTSEF